MVGMFNEWEICRYQNTANEISEPVLKRWREHRAYPDLEVLDHVLLPHLNRPDALRCKNLGL